MLKLITTFTCAHLFYELFAKMKESLILCLFVLFSKLLDAQAYNTSNPDSIKIITIDVDNFWITYDKLSQVQTLTDTIQVIQKYYLDRASNGLKEYIKASNSTVNDFSNAIKNHKQYLLSIRKSTTSIQNYKSKILEAARKLKSMYPSASFPQIYFVIGKFEVGGTQFPNFLYIGAELMCASPTSPLQEIKEDLRPIVSNVSNIATVCIHETIHYQQKYQDAKNILDGALIEGGADFITKQITGQTTAQSCFEYGFKHEKELWSDFKSQITSQNYLKWFTNIPDTINHRPGMLGYFIGFLICEDYYIKSIDKVEALKDIIELKDPSEIYKKTKYFDKE